MFILALFSKSQSVRFFCFVLFFLFLGAFCVLCGLSHANSGLFWGTDGRPEALSLPALLAAGSECQVQSSWYSASFHMATETEPCIHLMYRKILYQIYLHHIPKVSGIESRDGKSSRGISEGHNLSGLVGIIGFRRNT